MLMSVNDLSCGYRHICERVFDMRVKVYGFGAYCSKSTSGMLNTRLEFPRCERFRPPRPFDFSLDVKILSNPDRLIYASTVVRKAFHILTHPIIILIVRLGLAHHGTL